MVDKPVLASKLAAIRDAVARIREVLPGSAEALSEDLTAREIVMLNLFIALQEAIALGTHWLADEGWEVPQTYGDCPSVRRGRHRPNLRAGLERPRGPALLLSSVGAAGRERLSLSGEL